MPHLTELILEAFRFEQAGGFFPHKNHQARLI
jgi:hypothetical protein